jgi:hypothetical protein
MKREPFKFVWKESRTLNGKEGWETFGYGFLTGGGWANGKAIKGDDHTGWPSPMGLLTGVLDTPGYSAEKAGGEITFPSKAVVNGELPANQRSRELVDARQLCWETKACSYFRPFLKSGLNSLLSPLGRVLTTLEMESQ